MKKNRTWRAAGLMLVLTLATSCFVGGTFAKYTTKGGASDRARVARFGVTVEGGGSLFAKNYVNADGGNTPGTAGATLTVRSSNDDNVIAPGTKNDGAGLTFGVTGKPEVTVSITSSMKAWNIFLKAGTYAKMAKVKLEADTYETGKYYTMDGGTGEFTKSNDNFTDGTAYYELQDETVEVIAAYYPVQYKLDGATGNAPSVEADSLTNGTAGAEGAAKLIANKLGLTTSALGADGVTTYTGAASKEVAANTDLSTALSLANEKLTWEWDFDDKGKGTYDQQDTLLGDLMAYVDEGNSAYAIVLVEDVAGTGATSTYKYTLLKANDDQIVTKNGATIASGDDFEDNAYACLKTGIELSVTVTQVD